MQKIMFNDRYGLTRAVLEGRKTMTRRIIKAPKRINGHDTNGFIVCQDIATHEVTGIYARGYDGGTIDDIEILLKYEIGEVVAIAQDYSHCGGIMSNGIPRLEYISKVVESSSAGWRNKMFVRADLMPHQIRITGISVERLQDISDKDCLSEGIRYIPEINKYYFERADRDEGFYFNTPREAFASLIDKVSGRGTWKSNPWVFVYEFELVS